MKRRSILVLLYNLHTPFNDNEQIIHLDENLDSCEHNRMRLRKIVLNTCSP
jgi:hypothetical protein